MTEHAEIICKDLHVEFPLFDNVSRSVKARMGGNSGGIKTFRALKGINITIAKGERVGLLGNNGAGKSTFLRTLAGVHVPKSGHFEINTEVTSLFEVGVGTDPNASGYENIPLLMAARGISKVLIEDVVADIEEFTELGGALCRPLRTYSAGMRLRIAFAVATFTSSGILLMDEVVGVGDASFRQKANARIENMMKDSVTLVLASHSETFLTAYCKRGLVFDGGKIVFDGGIHDAIQFHKV